MTDSDRSSAVTARLRDAVRAELPDVRAIYLFGSCAVQTERPDSDLDLAVLLPHGAGIPDRLGIVSRLSEIAGREVDLVDLRDVGDILRFQVITRGKPLFKANLAEMLAWEGESMTRYQHHRQRIAPLLRQFEETGIGYAQPPA